MMDINLKVLCEWLKDRTDEFTVLDALEAGDLVRLVRVERQEGGA